MSMYAVDINFVYKYNVSIDKYVYSQCFVKNELVEKDKLKSWNMCVHTAPFWYGEMNLTKGSTQEPIK